MYGTYSHMLMYGTYSHMLHTVIICLECTKLIQYTVRKLTPLAELAMFSCWILVSRVLHRGSCWSTCSSTAAQGGWRGRRVSPPPPHYSAGSQRPLSNTCTWGGRKRFQNMKSMRAIITASFPGLHLYSFSSLVVWGNKILSFHSRDIHCNTNRPGA